MIPHVLPESPKPPQLEEDRLRKTSPTLIAFATLEDVGLKGGSASDLFMVEDIMSTFH